MLCNQDGEHLIQHNVQNLVRAAAKQAAIKDGVHILRHSFCSHLSMRGAPLACIRELAGHKNVSPTQMYMHLGPSASDSAIQFLDERLAVKCGDIRGDGRRAKD